MTKYVFIGLYARAVIKNDRLSEWTIGLLPSDYQQHDWEHLLRQGLITSFEKKKLKVEKSTFELFLAVIKLLK